LYTNGRAGSFVQRLGLIRRIHAEPEDFEDRWSDGTAWALRAGGPGKVLFLSGKRSKERMMNFSALLTHLWVTEPPILEHTPFVS
jgi:hypothetical protein